MASKKIRPFNTYGIVVKKSNPEATKLASEVAQFLTSKKKKILSNDSISIESLILKADILLVFGGDGTLISVARRMVQKSIPILGINMGQLGFLTEIKKNEIFEQLTLVLKGKFEISERALLECTLKRKGKTLIKAPFVNDVVLSKGSIARIFDLKILCDGNEVTQFKGDGLIVSTPTGSTAYNLAAGGPIVSPAVEALILTPICPHSLTQRPLILPDQSKICVVPQTKSDSIHLTLDGQTSIELHSGDEIFVTRYKKHLIKLIHSKNRDYFSILREKLKYGFRD
jgi:NAD+ kinase